METRRRALSGPTRREKKSLRKMGAVKCGEALNMREAVQLLEQELHTENSLKGKALRKGEPTALKA